MTTIASALLPSDDEEDQDFDPSHHPDDDTRKRKAEGANRWMTTGNSLACFCMSQSSTIQP